MKKKISSSPSRAEKFAPPLMRFLRSNGGSGSGSRSRSRRRSRASPMFNYLRGKKNAGVMETPQEPTSPKVTCIGQVRVRGSKKKAGGATTRNRPCRWPWFKKILCPNFTSKCHKAKLLSRFVPSWRFLFPSGCCGKDEKGEDSLRAEPIPRSKNVDNLGAQLQENEVDFLGSTTQHVGADEVFGAQIQENKGDFLGSSSVTRENVEPQIQENKGEFLSSSSPHSDRNHEILEAQIQENKGEFLSSSSPHSDNNHEILEAQIQENKGEFPGPSSPHTEKNQEILKSQIQENKGEKLDSSSPPKNALQKLDSSSPPKNALLLTRCRSAPYRCSSLASRLWGSPLLETENNAEWEAKIRDETDELKKPTSQNQTIETRISHGSEEFEGSSNNLRISKAIREGVAVHPLLLTRSKSEPARRGERLNPETRFWRQVRYF